MMRSTAVILILVLLPGLLMADTQSSDYELVILMHGLARTADSMQPMAERLEASGYQTINIDYPSRTAVVPDLVESHLLPVMSTEQVRAAQKVHFVTHSMGGIMVRQYLSQHRPTNLGRVVMLSPPNQGSEVVDKLGSWAAFDWVNGPAGQQLGTGKNSLPLSLPAADFDLGVIAGNQSVNLMLSRLIPGEDDGKVSVERAKLQGMKDFLVVPHSHPFIMSRDPVMKQTLYYLKKGQFDKASTKGDI